MGLDSRQELYLNLAHLLFGDRVEEIDEWFVFVLGLRILGCLEVSSLVDR